MGKNHQVERQIIETAARLFSEKSYAGTSVRDISNTLNLSIATIYYYFKNKEDLLFKIIHSIGEELLSKINNVIEESDDPLERFRNMIFAHVCLMKGNKDRIKVYVEEQNHLSKKYRQIIYNQHRQIYDTYVDQLKNLKKLKIINIDSLPIVAFAIFGMTNWCYRWFKEDGEISIEGVAQRIINLLFNGILNQEKKSSFGSK